MNITIEQVVHSRLTFPPVRKGFSTCVHDRHVVALHYRVKGKYRAGEETAEIETPICGILAAGEKDGNALVGYNEAYWCLFSGDMLHTQPDGRTVRLQVGRIDIRRSHFRPLNDNEASWFLHRFEDLYAITKSLGIESDLRATGKLLEILAAWSAPELTPEGENHAVRRYRALIEQHAGDPRSSLSELAEQVGITPNHLAGLFRREYGGSPVEYRTRLRLVRAEQLLLASTLSVAEIAREVGFPDPAYFTRVFRRANGMGPREFVHNRRVGR